MIDFRYFLVTIAAIFLALAVGIALGAGPMKGGLDAQLRGSVEQLGKEKNDLRKQMEQMEQIDKYRDAFASEVAPGLIRNRLNGQRVVLVVLPESDNGVVKGMRDALTESGATVTGTVQVTPKWADPQQRQFLDDLASQLATGDVQLPDQGSAYDRAGALLARAVVTKDETASKPDSATTTIMSGFGEGELVKADADELGRADLAVLVAPKVPDTPKVDAKLADQENQAWVALCRALDEASKGCVMAGDASAAEDSGALSALRSDGRAAQKVSSVDAANLPSGQVAVIWALVEQLGGKVGQYGSVGTTDGALPQFASGS
ncbi:copper transporter [Flindersiella endophytica]